jgi:hypothetical protein
MSDDFRDSLASKKSLFDNKVHDNHLAEIENKPNYSITK